MSVLAKLVCAGAAGALSLVTLALTVQEVQMYRRVRELAEESCHPSTSSSSNARKSAKCPCELASCEAANTPTEAAVSSSPSLPVASPVAPIETPAALPLEDPSIHAAMPIDVLSRTTGFTEAALQNPVVSLARQAQVGVISRADTWLSCQLSVLCDLSVEGSLATLQFILAQIPEWTAESTLKYPDARLSSIVGIDAELWSTFDPTPPSELRPFQAKYDKSASQLLLAASAQTFVVFLKCNRMDLMYDLIQRVLGALGILPLHHTIYSGFRYGEEGRDLSGFVDGSRNFDGSITMLQAVAIIDGKTFSEGATVPGPEADQLHLGGSYCYFARFVHDLKTFGGLSLAEKSDTIGRDFGCVKATQRGPDSEVSSGCTRYENPLLDIEPTHSHLHMCYLPLLRQGFPYQSVSEHGLLFSCFAKSLSKVDEVLDRMTRGWSAGVPDKIFSFTKGVEGGYLYVPSIAELSKLTTGYYSTSLAHNRELQYRHQHPQEVHSRTPSRGHSRASSIAIPSQSQPSASPNHSRRESFSLQSAGGGGPSSSPVQAPASNVSVLPPKVRVGNHAPSGSGSNFSLSGSPQGSPPSTPAKPNSATATPFTSPVAPPQASYAANAFKPIPVAKQNSLSSLPNGAKKK